MMEDFLAQAKRFGTDVRFGLATKVDFSGPVHKVWVDENKLIEADTVIIATGASAKWLGLPSEQRLNGFGVSACAVCDGFFFRGQEVAIVGGGDTAAEEATYLAKLCKKVHMIVRKDELRASKAMQHRVFNTPNLEVHFNTDTLEILGEKTVSGARLKNNKTGEEFSIEVSGFFVAIGHQPNSSIFSEWLEMDESGYIKTIPGSSKTNVPGIFACGDVQDHIYRQAVTAAGSGCMAALDAERYLASRGIEV
jgi:thioredoxin reductase (NADPH)